MHLLQVDAQTLAPSPQPATVIARDETISDCIFALARSDGNRNNYLDRGSEYIAFLNLLSSQRYANVTSFDELPLPVTTQFDVWADRPLGLYILGSFPGTESATSVEQQETLNDFCYDTITVLEELSTSRPSLQPSMTPSSNTFPTPPLIPQKTFEECLTGMFVSDIDPMDMQLDQVEYVGFVNYMSDNQYAFPNYETLPDILRFNFVVLADFNPTTGIRTIDINGTSPGIDLNDVPVEQVDYLMKICDQTETSLNELNLFLEPESMAPSVTPDLDLPRPSPFVGTRPPPSTGSPVTFVPTISSVPSLAPIISASQGPTVSFNDCRVSIAISDANRDNLLNDQEYVHLVYRLSENDTYRFVSFEELPMNLKTNFNSLAAQGQTIGQINTYGAFPSQIPTEEEELFLQQVCQDTISSIAAVPTPAPVLMPSVSPTRDFSECLRDIAFSDTSPRNNFLGEQEYTVFINLLSNGAFWRASNFRSLPRVLQDNFKTLASVERENPDENGNGNAIYVYGAIPPLHMPDAIQFEFLRRVCEDTEAALDEAIGAPSTPSTPAPFLPPIAPTTPAPSTITPTRSLSLAPESAPIVPTKAPSLTSSPVAPGSTSQPTLRPTQPTSRAPTRKPAGPAPTAEPASPDEAEDDGGVNVGAIVGGLLGGLAFLVMACVGCYLFSSTILVLLACCGFDEDGNRISKKDGNQTDVGEGSENEEAGDGEDGFEGFGQPGAPRPGEGAFENIASAASPSGYGGDDDLEAGAFNANTPSKEFGQYGGPDLPMDFGVDLENLSTESSGSEEMRPSDAQGGDENASEYSEEASEYREDQNGGEFAKEGKEMNRSKQKGGICLFFELC